jgi:transposase
MKALLKSIEFENQLELGDRTQLLEMEQEGKRFVLAGGKFRQQRDRERRETRIQAGEKELLRISQVKRKNPNAQKLSSQVGRALQTRKAHKYFEYSVDENGVLSWAKKQTLIQEEECIDGWYLLHTSLSLETHSGKTILGHYKNLLTVENAFCHLKSYMEMRPVHHRRSDRVRNHIRICFLSFWLTAVLGQEWLAKGVNIEAPHLLRNLQSIRIGILKIKNKTVKRLITRA